MISLIPSSINLSTPLIGNHLIVTSLLDQSKVIIWSMKDGNGQSTFKLGPIVTHGIQMPKTNPLQQDSPIPCMPHEQTPWQPTTGPSGTQWSEDLFRGPSQASDSQLPSHENDLTREPEPEIAPMQLSKEPFGKYFLFFVFFSVTNSPSPLLPPSSACPVTPPL
ncbi:hypothetical protein O181_044248 [Austropuccinia psidii MF-1]|uniref:Uncharacterized protein n=1 Tax=Austropuccinia psidii MF-1 TaxID=1389203 RepID=A0A9Q3HGG5_9BASI|nr:hypothetical protein [Austropuccinia psidii MF-1]